MPAPKPAPSPHASPYARIPRPGRILMPPYTAPSPNVHLSRGSHPHMCNDPSPNAPAIPCAMTPSPNARTYPWKLDPRPYTQRRRLPDILAHLSAAQICLYDHGTRNLSATSKRHVSPLSAAKATVPSRKDLCSRNTASTSTTMVEGPGTNFPFTCASTPFLRSLCHDHTCVIACVMTTHVS